jgi:hypothetical protein
MDVKTVVVMTCNHGQSELLLNFVCSTKARGFDLTNVLVSPPTWKRKNWLREWASTPFAKRVSWFHTQEGGELFRRHDLQEGHVRQGVVRAIGEMWYKEVL